MVMASGTLLGSWDIIVVRLFGWSILRGLGECLVGWFWLLGDRCYSCRIFDGWGDCRQWDC